MTPSSTHRISLAVSLATALVMALLATAWAQLPGGTIHLYSDPAFADTTATDTAPGTLSIYVVWRDGPPGGVAWWFKLTESPGFTGVWTGDTPHTGGVFGDTRTGIHLVETGCLASPAHIVTVTYQVFGTSLPCAAITVMAADASGVRINSCDSGGMLANGGELIVNPGVGCVVASETTTWGGVKSLYR